MKRSFEPTDSRSMYMPKYKCVDTQFIVVQRLTQTQGYPELQTKKFETFYNNNKDEKSEQMCQEIIKRANKNWDVAPVVRAFIKYMERKLDKQTVNAFIKGK